MFLNSKNTAFKIDPKTSVPDRRRKGHGFFTFANPSNRKQRCWGIESESTEGIFLKADKAKDLALPPGVILLRRQVGAAVRSFLLGPKGIVSGLVN